MKKRNNYLKSCSSQLKRMYRIHIKKELYASEVLESTFKELIKKHSNSRIVFLEMVSTVIADDSDQHRIRKGLMGYKEVRIFQFNEKCWVLGSGKAWGDYPARPYGGDIIAIKILPDESVSAEKIAEKILIGGGFGNSLLISKHGVILTIAKKDCFREGAFINLNETILKSSIQYSEINIRYKTDLVKILAELIPQILAKS